VKDSIYYVRNGRLGIDITIDEGRQYYFRNITWTGNSQYSSDFLNSILRIRRVIFMIGFNGGETHKR
jgi:outer membrane protein insertion porin family